MAVYSTMFTVCVVVCGSQGRSFCTRCLGRPVCTNRVRLAGDERPASFPSELQHDQREFARPRFRIGDRTPVG